MPTPCLMIGATRGAAWRAASATEACVGQSCAATRPTDAWTFSARSRPA